MTATSPHTEAALEDALRLLRAEQARLGARTWLTPTAALRPLHLGPVRTSNVLAALEARGLIETRTHPAFRVRLLPTRTRQLTIDQEGR